MAKFSVYVPDDLLEEARRADPSLKPSAVLQDALRSHLTDRQSRPYVQLTDELEQERAEAQRLVLGRVSEAYRVGYEVGLDFSRYLPWEAFENFGRLGWDLHAFRQSFDDEEYPHLQATEAEAAAGNVVLDWKGTLENSRMQVGFFLVDDDEVPVGIVGEGFVDAIRDVWLGARELGRSAKESRTADVAVSEDPE